jgi:hypothetical protein
MPLLPHHYLIAFLVTIVVGLVASTFFGVWQRARAEARAGTEALCTFKWRDYAHLVEDILIERGFKRSGGERRPGDGGFDLIMERGKSKYIVACKNGAAHEVTEKEVASLATVMQMNGAEGAVLATTGSADAGAMRLAAHRGIEILAGDELWRQARPWVPHDVRDDVQAEARAERNKLALFSTAMGVAGGVLALLLIPMLQREATDLAEATSQAVAEDDAEVDAARAREAAGLPLPPDLSPDEAAARRARAAMELRGVPAVHNATWSTRSTLVVTLKPGTGRSIELPQELCLRILQFEELRYTRMQIETPSDDIDAPPTVRWRQCR